MARHPHTYPTAAEMGPANEPAVRSPQAPVEPNRRPRPPDGRQGGRRPGPPGLEGYATFGTEEPGLGAGAIVAGAEDVSKVYGAGETAVRALDGVTVGFPIARFTAIMGPSGSGKSTLLHCLAGLDTVTSGRVFIGDVDLGSLRDKELTRLRRTRIGFVFQAFNLVPTLTAAENITLPLTLGGARGEPAWIDAVIDTVGLRDRLRHRPSELSGGQQQRAAVARALASRPQIIFADEPTGNLDSRSGGDILGFMREAVDDLGQTIVMVTHDPVAAGYADTVVFLADGHIVDEMPSPTAASVLDRLKALDDQPSPRHEPRGG